MSVSDLIAINAEVGLSKRVPTPLGKVHLLRLIDAVLSSEKNSSFRSGRDWEGLNHSPGSPARAHPVIDPSPGRPAKNPPVIDVPKHTASNLSPPREPPSWSQRGAKSAPEAKFHDIHDSSPNSQQVADQYARAARNHYEPANREANHGNAIKALPSATAHSSPHWLGRDKSSSAARASQRDEHRDAKPKNTTAHVPTSRQVFQDPSKASAFEVHPYAEGSFVFGFATPLPPKYAFLGGIRDPTAAHASTKQNTSYSQIHQRAISPKSQRAPQSIEFHNSPPPMIKDTEQPTRDNGPSSYRQRLSVGTSNNIFDPIEEQSPAITIPTLTVHDILGSSAPARLVKKATVGEEDENVIREFPFYSTGSIEATSQPSFTSTYGKLNYSGPSKLFKPTESWKHHLSDTEKIAGQDFTFMSAHSFTSAARNEDVEIKAGPHHAEGHHLTIKKKALVKEIGARQWKKHLNSEATPELSKRRGSLQFQQGAAMQNVLEEMKDFHEIVENDRTEES